MLCITDVVCSDWHRGRSQARAGTADAQERWRVGGSLRQVQNLNRCPASQRLSGSPMQVANHAVV